MPKARVSHYSGWRPVFISMRLSVYMKEWVSCVFRLSRSTRTIRSADVTKNASDERRRHPTCSARAVPAFSGTEQMKLGFKSIQLEDYADLYLRANQGVDRADL